MNVIDEYDKGEPQRDARRLTVRWKAESRNVMTDDGPDEMALHIATFASPAVAQHITELHNRTFGDGQAGPEEASPVDAASLARNWGQGRPASRTLMRIDITQRIHQLVHDLVAERVADYLARAPIRIQIDNDPAEMANVLTKLGYQVTAPVDMKADPR